MKVVGVIVEYNPFHNGHLYHIHQAKKITGADYVVAIMSGNFLQRGVPALTDQWSRTHMAIDNGIDLVIQLPVVYSTASAEYFSLGAISILNNLGVVDYVCFGSEVGDISILEYIASIFEREPIKYKEYLHHYLSLGHSFPSSRSKALLDYCKEDFNQNFSLLDIQETISNPNNILGIEYIKALIRTNSQIKPVTITRQQTGYHDTAFNRDIVSASAIRNHLLINNTINGLKPKVPNNTFKIIKNAYQHSLPIFYDDFSTILFYKLMASSHVDLIKYADISDGLEDRIKKFKNEYMNISQLVENLKTKRHTYTRIQRGLCHIILDIKKDDFNLFINNIDYSYIKILGFKKTASPLMKSIKTNANYPIISNANKSLKTLTTPALKLLKKDIYATEVYNLIVYNKFNKSLPNDLTQKFIIK